MEGKKIPQLLLNSGHKMPVIGFGSAASPLPLHHVLISIFIDAFKSGYRHFDTASIYGTEEPLGKAIAQALEEGLIKSRDEVYVTSKLWNTDAHHDLVLQALKKTLQNLGLDYIDLYLIHWPVRLKQGVEGFKISKEDVLPFDIKGTWEAMEECHRLGLAKSIGVSNFGTIKLSQLLENATIPPAVNQVEMNPSWQQWHLREFCQQKGIHVSAWSPLGAYKSLWGSPTVMENPILQEIATTRHKTVAQIALRWIYEQGASAIVKSFNNERMRDNLDIFDWELTQDEVEKIRRQIPQHRMYKGEMFISENGSYKSLDQLWDGEP